MRKLTTDDILDLRAYERVRDEFRREVIDLKKRRRVHLGDVVTLVFENSTTMRFQIQEMARAEKMLRDEQIEHEVATYNELIPDAGELSATLFIELDDEWKLREWLPRLVGIQNSIVFRLADGSEVRGFDPNEERLTREDVTAAVHFLKFVFTPEQVAAFRSGPVELAIDHFQYEAAVTLDTERHAELVADFAA
jgi:hypothetical protein